MLKIISSMNELDFEQMCSVYKQSNSANAEDGRIHLFDAERDFYDYLLYFFSRGNAFCAVWACGGQYVAALRIEPYCDGLLLTGLETAPEEREKGYATQLLSAVLEYLRVSSKSIVYSHVIKNNPASLAVHKKCGFVKHLDYAVYVDDSVSQNAYTLICK